MDKYVFENNDSESVGVASLAIDGSIRYVQIPNDFEAERVVELIESIVGTDKFEIYCIFTDLDTKDIQYLQSLQKLLPHKFTTIDGVNQLLQFQRPIAFDKISFEKLANSLDEILENYEVPEDIHDSILELFSVALYSESDDDFDAKAHTFLSVFTDTQCMRLLKLYTIIIYHDYELLKSELTVKN